MSQKSLAVLLRCLIVGVAVCGAVVFFAAVPKIGLDTVEAYPEYAHAFVPWLIFLWIAAIPCYAVLVLLWRAVSNIARDRSFCRENAQYLKWCSLLVAADTAFFFAGNLVFLFLSLTHPGVCLLSLLVIFAGVSVSIVFAALSHLILKAAVLQEQSDLTI